MTPFDRKKTSRGVFDPHESAYRKLRNRFRLKNLIYGRDSINLRRPFRLRHPWILTLIVLLFITGTFLALKGFFAKGEVKNFFPTTCLGDWQDPSAAAGIPETTLSASSSFSPSNSAVYTASATEIYCGGFIPADFSTSGTLTSVTLNLVWQVGDSPYVPPPIDTNISTSSIVSSTISSGDDTSSTDTSSTPINNSSTNSSLPSFTPASSTNTIDTSSPSSFLPIKNFFASIINHALAQDDGSDTTDNSGGGSAVSTPADNVSSPAATTTTTSNASPTNATSTPSASPTVSTSTATATPASSNTLTPPPSSTPSTVSPPPDDASTTEIDISSSTESSTIDASDAGGALLPTSTVAVIVPPTAPDENFLQVSYSTNGQLWIQLQKVNIDNWPNLTLAIPISNWADLQNLQIKVEAIPTTQDPIPPVYLDGMVLEANYQVTSDESVVNATSTYSQFLTDKSLYTIGDQINIVGAPPLSYIEIYALDDPNTPGVAANDFGIQIDNLGETAIDSNTLSPGRYIFVNTFEPGACNEYTITQCEARDDYIDQLQITVTSSTED